MERSATKVLQDIFGYHSFRGEQQNIIDAVNQARDSLVIMPTGGGKSLCYQIPALMLKGTAIVISPLISLMKDQVDQLAENGILAACLNSSQTQKEQKEVIEKYELGQLKLLYVAPERFNVPSFLSLIKRIQPSLIAIDEAHCISQWGHDFRPEYRDLAQVKQHFPNTPITALTATADNVTRQDIINLLDLHDPFVSISSFDRPNISYTVTEKINGTQQLDNFLSRHKNESGIIYCSSRKKVDETAERLLKKGFSVAAYHAGLSNKIKASAQEKFLRDDIQIIVATIAFGMGINKSNVRFVVHVDTPKNIESYYQETGRAGRDGLPAEALLLFNAGDLGWYRRLLSERDDSPQKDIELHKLNAMSDFAQSQTCRRLVLLNYFDENRQEPCNNCDICFHPPKHYDGLEDAQKVLSCVYRVGQRFGITYIIDVLRGLNNTRITSYGHEKLSVYGIGKDKTKEYWQSVIRQLIHQGLLYQDITNFSTLKLTEASRPILKGQQPLSLAIPRLDIVKKTRSLSKTKHFTSSKNDFSYNKDTSVSATVLLSDEEKLLFARLRGLRKRLADESGVPPYVIFNDATLYEMSQYQPTDTDELLKISGVGHAKLDKYGDEFLEVIEEFVFGM